MQARDVNVEQAAGSVWSQWASPSGSGHASLKNLKPVGPGAQVCYKACARGAAGWNR